MVLVMDASPLMSKIDRMMVARSFLPITAVQWKELTQFVVTRKKNDPQKGCATHYVDIELPSGIRLLHLSRRDCAALR